MLNVNDQIVPSLNKIVTCDLTAIESENNLPSISPSPHSQFPTVGGDKKNYHQSRARLISVVLFLAPTIGGI